MALINTLSIAIVTVIITVIILFLITLNRKLSQRISEEKNKFLLYRKEVAKLKDLKSPKEELEMLDKLSRYYFKEKFNFNDNLTYLELAERFTKQKETKTAEFCKIMSDVTYSSDEVDSKKVRKARDLFSKILSKSKIA